MRLGSRQQTSAGAAGALYRVAVGSAILSNMPDRRRSWKTDSQWLRLSLAATGLGVSLIVASAAAWKSSPVTYVGATLAFVGAYLACAVLVFPLPLPMLLSERRNRAFRRGVGAFLVEGHELRARPVADTAELALLETAQPGLVRARTGLAGRERPPCRRCRVRARDRSFPGDARLLRPRPQRLAPEALLAARRAARPATRVLRQRELPRTFTYDAEPVLQAIVRRAGSHSGQASGAAGESERAWIARGRGTPGQLGVPLAEPNRLPRDAPKGEPSSDAEIERGLRERAVSDPRAALTGFMRAG